MSSVGNVLRDLAARLKKAGARSSCLSSIEIMAHVLQIKRMDLYLAFDRKLSAAEKKQIDHLLSIRASGTPLEYVLGNVEFYDCRLRLTKDVLIPRPETEILVDLIVRQLQKEDLRGKKLWDIGCGSGCIGIAIKKKLPDLQVTLSDISERALTLARENAQLNGVEVSFCQGDLLLPFSGERADFLVSNPPYIPTGEYLTLGAEVKDFEPRLALEAGTDGLDYFRRLKEQMPAKLSSSAKIFFEMGYNQEPQLRALFDKAPWKRATAIKDWAGYFRFFLLEIE